MKFLLEHVTPLTKIGRPDLDAGMVDAILEEAGKLAEGVLAPLNATGDQVGAQWNNGEVATAPGFKDAYTQYCQGGWNAVPFDPEFGGQGLPWLLSFPVQEMWQGANLSFGLCPLLNQGAVDAIHIHGTKEQQELYLPKLISGEWTGTMNLTEPQAGSDLALLRSRAQPNGDGTYKVFGQKIFITYGEHDMADNIIHLVLARLPDAPPGTRGISLFIVPKWLDENGERRRNDLTCISLEHKLGIHASPTCTMQFGDNGGATGYLLGEENEGLKCMFTMMNNARLSVGLQGVAIAERALQAALEYAAERRQGKPLAGGDTVAIIEHPDIRRMLMRMKALTQAGRALAYEAASYLDLARTGDKAAQARVDFLTPIVKAWCTDLAQEVTYLGVQIHGGMGFIEETGVAQYYRDARILPIYEGTNGIQANDLIFRKILRDNGAAFGAWRSEVGGVLGKHEQGRAALADLDAAVSYLTANAKDLDVLAASAVSFLKLAGIIAGAAMLERSAQAAQGTPLADSKRSLADFFIGQCMTDSNGLTKSVQGSSAWLQTTAAALA
jgi:alkylation response protein AidB-like acyl-CoA dehydrogenase